MKSNNRATPELAKMVALHLTALYRRIQRSSCKVLSLIAIYIQGKHK